MRSSRVHSSCKRSTSRVISPRARTPGTAVGIVIGTGTATGAGGAALGAPAATGPAAADPPAGLAARAGTVTVAAAPLGARAGTGTGIGQNPDDTLFYIFTSGTTGLPKATQCSHQRYVAGATSEGALFDLTEADRMYVVLPMFHIAALSAIGAALSVGASVVIRSRFSACLLYTSPSPRDRG